VKRAKKEMLKQTLMTNEIQKIIWEYFMSFFSIKLENQEGIHKFLNTYDPQELNLENMNNLNRSI
jgi:hypothetical protein